MSCHNYKAFQVERVSNMSSFNIMKLEKKAEGPHSGDSPALSLFLLKSLALYTWNVFVFVSVLSILNAQFRNSYLYEICSPF